MKDVTDILTCIFSAIAIIISLFTWIKTNVNTKKIAQKTLNTKFFEEIYFKHIITELPFALSKIQYNEGNICENCEVAEQIVFTILERSQFYKYFEPNFYDNIKEHLINLDEILVDMQDKSLNKYTLDKYKKDISSLTNKFYILLKTYYSEI